MSRSFRLQCSACGRTQDPEPRASVCPACGMPWIVGYPRPEDPAELPVRWRRRTGGMWRFRELLPLGRDEEPVTLEEGGTPCLRAPRLGRELGVDVWIKDEGRNPTGSFKDRGLSAAVTRAVRDGVESFVVPSAGNAGAALSAYAARAGTPARIFVPRDTPEGVRRRCRRYGADLVDVDGLITDCGDRAAEFAEATGAFDVSTLREPYRLQGKKTMMLEILESLGWEAPDAVVYPTGGGTGLIATWTVLGELRDWGILEERATRMYSVQSEGCAPMVRAWEHGHDDAERWEDAETAAYGLRVPSALGDFLILRALRESGGGAVAVSDEEMERGAEELSSREAVAAGIEGGAALAGLRHLVASGEIRPGERVVLFNTGNFLTY